MMRSKFTEAPMPSLRVGNQLLDGSVPRIMGILNTTPDSFYEPSRLQSIDAALRLAEKHLEHGAYCLDIGGYSSRPGATPVGLDEEKQRVLPTIKALVQHFPDAILSIDTFRSSIAKAALDLGAHMINDVSGGQDPHMFATVARYQVPYVLMHTQGTPQTMTSMAEYEEVCSEVFDFLRERLGVLHGLGCTDVMVDVGIGFAKALAHNYELLALASYFLELGAPLLLGISRKSFIYKVLECTPEQALGGTTALHFWALTQGVRWLRVHDVKEAQQTIRLFQAIQQPLSNHPNPR